MRKGLNVNSAVLKPRVNGYVLLPQDKLMSSKGYELIKVLNYKDETYKTT